jgi:hypothetical protein
VNWKLVFLVSGFGFVMGIATVFVIPPAAEPFCWAVILLISAYLLARHAPGLYFVHALAVGLLNSVWVVSAHMFWFERYLAGHPREAAMLIRMPLTPRAMMAVTGPLVGLVSGAILGLLTLIAQRVVVARR